MSSSISKVPLFRWELKDFRSQSDSGKNIISDNFYIGPFGFALGYYNYKCSMLCNNTYGVVLKDLGNKRSVEVSLKLWFENEEGQKFQENSIKKHIFQRIDYECKFYFKNIGNDWDLFLKVREHNKTLYICCEFTDLNEYFYVPRTDCSQRFYQNMWLMYQQGIHDATIRVNGTEFKILKSQFMAQSEVFKQMFTPDFVRLETNIIEINNVSEHAMNQLIKWMYTCQLEDQSVVEELYEVAENYQIYLLKINCTEIMINSLNNINVFRRFILAVMYNDQQLKNFSLTYISNMPIMEAAAYITSSEWIELAQINPVFVRELNTLINNRLNRYV